MCVCVCVCARKVSSFLYQLARNTCKNDSPSELSIDCLAASVARALDGFCFGLLAEPTNLQSAST